MVQLNFDARQHTPLDNDAIPDGWYDFIIDESSAAPTKDGNPNHLRLNLRASVMTGPHQGRKVFIGLNIRHTNVQTMEMANRELSAICAAVNLPYVQDTSQLHNIPFKGRVKVRKDPDGVYDDQAQIRSYKPITYVVPGLASQPAAAAPAQAPQGWTPQAAPQAPQGWQGQPQRPPQQNGGYPQQPQYQQPAAPPLQPAAPQNWQQPQNAQPWGQPPQQPPAQPPQQQTWQQPPQQPAQPPQQTQQPWQAPPAQQPAEPQAQPPQQPAPAGFAAPTPQQPAQQQPQQPENPAATSAQQAAPPWVRQPGT